MATDKPMKLTFTPPITRPHEPLPKPFRYRLPSHIEREIERAKQEAADTIVKAQADTQPNQEPNHE